MASTVILSPRGFFLIQFIIGIHLVNGEYDVDSKSMLGFCDKNFYVPKSQKDCGQGWMFGNNKPKCICIKGIYRMFLSNCEVADGFAENVCTLTKDEKGVEVRGVKLTKEPNWNKTGVVCEKGSGVSKSWEYTPENAKVRTGATEFYTIHGTALVSRQQVRGKMKQQICVQKKMQTPSICLYRHTDNVDLWHIEKATEIIVKPGCPKSGSWKPMRSNKCFKPLTLYDADCQVPCDKGMVHEGRFGSDDVGPVVTDTANLDNKIADMKPYMEFDSLYYNRKLITYLMHQELGLYNVTLISSFEHGPNKSFALLEIMKNITKGFCPGQYVPGQWIDVTVDLFHNLHHGDIFKYENELTKEEFEWIRDILLKCLKDKSPLEMYHDVDPGHQACDGVPRVNGFCNVTAGSACSDHKKVPIESIPPPYSDWENKHFIPEVNWLLLDVVHVACFPQFNESYRMFHLLEQTIEKLFTTRIKNYWSYPFWKARPKSLLVGTAADDYMYNLEACAEGAYMRTNRAPHRLIRPDPTKYLRKKRAAEKIASSFDVTCAKTRTDFQYPSQCTNMKPVSAGQIYKPQLLSVPTSG